MQFESQMASLAVGFAKSQIAYTLESDFGAVRITMERCLSARAKCSCGGEGIFKKLQEDHPAILHFREDGER